VVLPSRSPERLLFIAAAECMLVIVNADDLGTSERVNERTFELIDSGLVTSATLIANAPAFEAAAKQLKAFPKCSFGVHLNLTALPPVGPSRGLEPILDDNGHMSGKLFSVAMTPTLRAALLRELIAQVEREREFGVPISHFDSHQHVHTLPKLFSVLKALQRRFSVRKVRTTRNLFAPDRTPSRIHTLRKRIFDVALRSVYCTKSTEGFGEFRDFYSTVKAGRLERLRSLELMVHPGTSDSRYNEETALLSSGWYQYLPSDFIFGSYHLL